MSIADKPILLPDRYRELQPTFEGMQREVFRPLEVFSLDDDGYAIVRVTLGNYADDATAAADGVPIGALYRDGSVLKVRVS